MLNEVILKISDSSELESLLAQISNNFNWVIAGNQDIQEYYYDTFDWRLFNQNLCLIANNNMLSLSEYNTNSRISSEACKKPKRKYFWNSFRDKLLRDELKVLLQHRALLKICKCDKNTELFRLLNEDDKTIAKLSFEKLTISNDLNIKFDSCIIRIQGIRGYSKEFKMIKNIVASAGLKRVDDNYLFFIFSHLGRVPGKYSSKIKINLDAEMTTAESIRLILMKLADIIIESEDGIKQDIDIEFLHDYRVSVRKGRVILSELKNIIPVHIRKELKEIFAELGERTNNLRDLDVYLLKKSTYESYLPDVLKKELSPLFDNIRKERLQAFKKLKSFLISEENKNMILQMECLLEEDFTFTNSSEGDKPVLHQSKLAIYKRCKSILKIGRRIKSNSKDEQLHDLRLECKKLRYLLELFASLFPPKEIDFLVSQLKMIQDNLGDFNDLSVQQDKMKMYLDSYLGKSKSEINLASVIGGLITSLHQRNQVVRNEFLEIFKQFDSKKNNKIIISLFSS
ncbi:MAG: CHAD domain-containing protein [Bacteroidetes bacterium]|nr:CHAD domain-containing protein [Bacteroidota bacterium]